MLESLLALYLIAHVDVSILGQQQWHQVHAALLRRQVNRADALPRHCIGVGTILQQCGPNVHLVLFGSNVEWGVTILREPKEKGQEGGGMCSSSVMDGGGIILTYKNQRVYPSSCIKWGMVIFIITSFWIIAVTDHRRRYRQERAAALFKAGQAVIFCIKDSFFK